MKLIVSTGPRNASVDTEAAAECRIEIMHTNYDSSPTVELTWALILASARHPIIETASLQSSGWPRTVGNGLRSKVLGVLGLGDIGREVARIALAFGMEVMAWSENLTPEKAAVARARLVSKPELFQQADILTIHLVLSSRTRGAGGEGSTRADKQSARLVNTSRGPIAGENALLEALRERRLAGAAIDVFDVEPLPPEHPFRELNNVIPTPHIGYVSRDLYRVFYQDTVANIADWLGMRS